MADIALSVGSGLSPASLARRMALVEGARTWRGGGGTSCWGASRIDDPALWAPAWDPASRTRLLVGGRIALDPAEWDAAERTPFEGGLAARHLLAHWLREGSRSLGSHNGAAAIVVLDERSGEGWLVTDRMGFYPVFAARNAGLVVASHTDVVAALCREARRPCTVDETTIAEFLRTGMATHPHTYWREVFQLEPGAIYRFCLDDSSAFSLERNYWRPAYLDGADPLPRGAFIEELAEALRAAGRRRSHSRLGDVAVLLSAGADSRGVLFATGRPARATCFTYYDAPNPELSQARDIARLAGARHVALERAPGYYVDHADETVRLSGGMWSVEAGHHTGAIKSLTESANPGVLLTGCYADYLFKGIALNVRHRRLFGRSLPLHAIAPYEHQFHHPHCEIAQPWHDSVESRLAVRYGALTDTDRRALEHARLAPICREADASGRLALWRQAPVDPVFADSDVLEAYGRQSVRDKLSGLAFGAAIARVAGRRAAAILNNNYSAPVGGSAALRVAAWMTASARRKLDRALGRRPAFETNPVATYGSWPNLAEVARRSERMRSWFTELGRRDPLLAEIVGADTVSRDFDAFLAGGTTLAFRLFTASLWLGQQRRAPGDSAPEQRPLMQDHQA